ncbi:B3 domain-containing transcription repressor VAL1-like [Olea europaea var. sylvestris]|uniref:B3 domain-containing transcription repressor VAL1-like n=1 Tax=Olea europaea var. sylvestris TaxID=158386 RepID=UPI000C1D4664|nr:B3 domain-containing transcription repressor VAL1-like [Olea europaea var. sylvestris]
MIEGMSFVEMGSRICMNEVCRTTTSSEWKKGWVLKSGGFATLCNKCGSAYEHSVYCETFHPDESGWRQCSICGKRIHCGCIASRDLHEYMDSGGIGCINCVKSSEIHSMQSMQIHGDDIPNATFMTNGTGASQLMVVENRKDDDNYGFERLLHLARTTGASKIGQLSHSHQDGLNAALSATDNTCFGNLSQKLTGSSAFMRTDYRRPMHGAKELYEPLNQPSLNFSLRPSLVTSKPMPHFPSGIVEGSQLNIRGPRARDILPKPPKPSPVLGTETKKGTASQTRVARPPAEGRGRNQLLPRYWPKITDQELKQLSGDLKSTIVPLFEKVLSASDAGRIGRLVLPKACAEAYFPHINQSEGIPIRIQDIKGKEWTFQFRFWPNNNSRMYVLEGVTPCIQNMQVQAGDTVTFSRIDPGDQLVIGCRKVTDNVDTQDPQTPALPNDDSPGESSFSGPTDNLLSNGAKTSDESMQQNKPASEKKKTRNMKNKRLLMHNEDAMELRITWEEAQDLLRPSPTVQPTIVMIEDHAFEEYDEPPVFGKRTIFTSQHSGEQEQLAQCDICSKWRRLPVHVLLPAKWTCSENIWDSNRSSCSVPEDINSSDLSAAFRVCKESKRRRGADNKTSKDGEPSGLDALATAAVLGDNMDDLAESLVGATTKHPRHRPGCTCIVCIQPPSGKGKHEPTCECNVCLTVKRRFKTLMLRKKQRQSELAAELVLGKDETQVDLKSEDDDIAGHALLQMNLPESEKGKDTNPMDLDDGSKEQLDLNCHPDRENELVEAAGMSLATLIKNADIPSGAGLQKNELPSSEPDLLSRTASESGECIVDEGNILSGDVEQKNKGEDGESGTDLN